MSDKKLIFMHSAELDVGGYPEDCPFNTSRAGQTKATLDSFGLLELPNTRVEAPTPVAIDELRLFHSANYLRILERAGQGHHDLEALEAGLGTPDCPLFPDMFQYLRLAAGGSVDGAKRLLSGEADLVFNPSGGLHHAHADRSGGFCYLNDVVIAAKLLAQAGKRVLVLDIDVHHCDGVQDAFFDSNQVTVISLHESGKTLFPGTGYADEIGAGDGLGHTVNFPLPVGTYDDAYYSLFTGTVLPLIRQIAPDVLIVEVGLDALAGDPLAHLNLTNNCYADIIGDLAELDLPMLMTGGGGYNVPNTVRGWALLWNTLVHGKDDHHLDLAGMGGAMLQNTNWIGGLRDRPMLSDGGYRETVNVEISQVIDQIRATVFPLHAD